MKTYEPGWISSHAPDSTSNMKVPLPAPVTIGQSMPAFSSCFFCVKNVLRGDLDRAVALVHAAHVLRAAVVGLQAAEAQVRKVADLRASATAGSPGAMPQRRMPTSSSM